MGTPINTKPEYTYAIEGLKHAAIGKIITAIIVNDDGIDVILENKDVLEFRNAAMFGFVGGIVPNTQSRVQVLEDLTQVQGSDGNWNSDKYMLGLYNGMIFSLAVMKSQEPVYREWPYTKWQDFKRVIRRWFPKRAVVGMEDKADANNKA